MALVKPLIFPTYADAVIGENNCLAKGSLTSPTDILGGTLSGDNIAGAVFDRNGVQFNELSCIIITAAELGLGSLNELKTGYTVYMEISKNFWDVAYNPSAVRYAHFMDAGGNSVRWYRQSLNSDTIILDVDNNSTQGTVGVGYPDFVPVWITGIDGHIKVYTNYLLTNTSGWKNASNINNFYIGGAGISALPSVDGGVSIKNVAVWDRSMVNSSHRYSVGTIGDSILGITTYAQLDSGILTQVENGPVEPGFTTGPTAGFDSNCIPQLHRKLAAGGMFVSGERVQHWSVGGSTVTSPGSPSVNWTTMADRIVDLTTYNVSGSGMSHSPDFMCINIGTNDIGSSSPSHPSTDYTDGTFLNALQADIDAMRAAGVQFIILNTIMGRLDTDNTQLGDRNTRMDNANLAMKSLTGVDALVDQFTLFGGHSVTADKFTDGLHLSTTGSALYSDGVADAILGIL